MILSIVFKMASLPFVVHSFRRCCRQNSSLPQGSCSGTLFFIFKNKPRTNARASFARKLRIPVEHTQPQMRIFASSLSPTFLWGIHSSKVVNKQQSLLYLQK